MTQANFDPQELKKFAQLANHWWDEQGELRTLHQLNPLRVQFITQHTPIQDKCVLDVGCGGGILSESLAQLGALVTGIDMDESVIKVARQHQKLAQLTIDYRCQSIEALAEEQAEQYDVITCMEMLEHVPNPKSILKACATLLKPNGHLFLSTLNRNWKAYVGAVLAAEYVLKLLPKGTHDYRKFIKPSELCQWLREVDLSAQQIQGVSYNPLTQQPAFSEHPTINYLLYAHKRLS